MSKIRPIQKEIKGNIASDAVLACIKFYKKKKRRVKYINLQQTWWTMWALYMHKMRPDLDFDDNGIMFGNTIIRKGHGFMRERLEVEFHDSAPPFSKN